MKAKEMFGKLGYKRCISGDDIIYGKDEYNVFRFMLEEQQFSKSDFYSHESSYIRIEELKAVIQQCKELGWLGETI